MHAPAISTSCIAFPRKWYMYFVHIPYVTKQQQMRTPYCINMCYAYNNKKELHNAVVILPFTFYICQVLLCLLYFNTEKGFRGCTNDVSYIYTFSSLSAIPKQIDRSFLCQKLQSKFLIYIYVSDHSEMFNFESDGKQLFSSLFVVLCIDERNSLKDMTVDSLFRN